MITNWFLKRLSESSTWTGLIVGVLTSIGFTAGESTTQFATQIAVVLAAVFQMLKAEKGNK